MHTYRRRTRLRGRLRRWAGCLLRRDRDRGRGLGRRCSRRTGMHTHSINLHTNNIHTNYNDCNRTNTHTNHSNHNTNARTPRRVPPSHPHRIQTRT